MKELNIEALIVEISKGSKDALEKLYIHFRHAVYAFSLSILHSSSLAEDVSQEVFIKIWLSSHTYRCGRNPKAWIMGITKNAAIDILRKQKPTFDIYETDIKDPSNFEEQITSSYLFSQALQNLSDDEKEIVILKAVADLSVKEIGKITNTPQNTVYWKLNKALKSLRKMEVFYE